MKWNDRIGRRIKLHDVHVLMIVAEHGSMGKAAERLAISQPSVSKSIADLERAIGKPLLNRTPRGVEPTPYGAALLRRGVGAFEELKQAVDDIEYLADPRIGEIRVGCPDAIGAGLLCEVIDRFTRKSPDVIVSVVAANNMSPEFRPLRERRVDFLIGRLAQPFAAHDRRFDARDLDSELLFHERWRVVAGKQHELARRRKVQLEDLVAARWILTPDEMSAALIAGPFIARNLPVPRASIRAYATNQKFNLLATNRYIAAVSSNTARFNIDRFALKVLPVEFETEPWPVGIVTLKNRAVSPLVEKFLECVRDVAGKHP